MAAKRSGCSHTHIRQNRHQARKDGYYIMIKGTIHQEDITFINIYVPNIGALKCIKQLLTDLRGKS